MSRDRGHCANCHKGFLYDAATQVAGRPLCCGRKVCVAMLFWGPEEWAGRARMARARKAAGRILVAGPVDPETRRPTFVWSTKVLDAVDREALRRVVRSGSLGERVELPAEPASTGHREAAWWCRPTGPGGHQGE